MADMLINAIRLDEFNPDKYVEVVRVDQYLLDVSVVLNWLEYTDNRAFVKRFDGEPIELQLRCNPKSFFGPNRWLVTHPDERFLPELISVTRC